MDGDTAASLYLSSSELPAKPATPTLHGLLDDRREGGGMVPGWSEATLTGAAQSGRYSTWSTEEGEYDRVAKEKVDRMFSCLNRALYETRPSGFAQTDRECREWSLTFPHLQVKSEHLFDVMDDGTEIADPIYRDDPSTTDEGRPEDSDGLVVVGRHIEPISLSDTPEEAALKEEILAQHGVLEEYIAFDSSSPQRESTAEDGVKQVVLSQLLDVLWSEVAPILQPLLIAARDRAMKVQSSRQSLQTSLATSHRTSPRESCLLLSHPPPPGTAHGPAHHSPHFYQNKPGTSSLVVPSLLPQLAQPPPPLSGLMQIKPVSLRRRNMSLLPQNERVEEILSRLSIRQHHHHQNTTTTASQLPDSVPGLSAHFRPGTRPNHHLSSALPSTPPTSYRGTHSGRVGLSTVARRPQQLRPIENPRTPALERIEQAQIRGYRLPVNTGCVGLSPPPTAGGGVASVGVASGGSVGVVGSGHVRNNQLPPLEIGGGAITTTERSPPVVRGKSSFSQRNSSAAFSELQELRRQQQLLAAGTLTSDLRPSTSGFRVESGKTIGAKKLSDATPRGSGGGEMKIVGHATRVSYSTSSVGGATGVEVGGGGKLAGGLPYSIAEDEELADEETGRLNVTGHSSAFLKSKPRSLADNRSKHRGHGR